MSSQSDLKRAFELLSKYENDPYEPSAEEVEAVELYEKYIAMFGKEPEFGLSYLGDPEITKQLKQSIETGEPIPDLPEGCVS